MAVSFGINPITWTNDDMPELGGDIPLGTCLAETRIAHGGYTGRTVPLAKGPPLP